jgi:5-methylcytosine-specific restriction endonuclease McrA
MEESKRQITPQLRSLYWRIKKKCCNEWSSDPISFFDWYDSQTIKQKGVCFYCGLPGDTLAHYGKHFREGRRGINLEVDRKVAKELYSPENCVLACYPCNNAKSDVFTHEEFVEIGKSIRKTKKICHGNNK